MARYSLDARQSNAKVVAYEKENADLPPQTRRILALFTIARASTRGVIKQILGYDSAVLFRDHAKRWWIGIPLISRTLLKRLILGQEECHGKAGPAGICRW